MPKPFLILSLPRSRSAWMAKWLSSQGASVGHDLGAVVDRVQDFIQLWRRGLQGTCETGAETGAGILAASVPGLRLITVRRPREEVLASFAKLGEQGEWLDSQLRTKDLWLDAIERELGALSIPFSDLGSPDCAGWIWEELHETPFNYGLWRSLSSANVQVDWAERKALHSARADAQVGLRDQVWRLNTGKAALVMEEPWQQFAGEEMRELGKAHQREADRRDPRSYSLDEELLAQLASQCALLVVSARLGGRLVGYCLWTLAPDPIARGRTLATQGAFYAEPGLPKLGLGEKMLKESLLALRARGIENCLLHSPAKGRGTKLASLYTRLGAVPHQQVFELDLSKAH